MINIIAGMSFLIADDELSGMVSEEKYKISRAVAWKYYWIKYSNRLVEIGGRKGYDTALQNLAILKDTFLT